MTDNSTLPDRYVITIGRSFGAGGRAVGRRLAERLGIDYYDKELLFEAAGRAGMDKGLFEKNDERAPGFLAGLLPMSMGYNALAWYAGPNNVSGEAVYRAQSEFIREIADKRPCVIVGRTADYILRERNDVVNIFLHAPEQACIDRIIGRADCHKPDDARNLIRKTNRLRSEFYNFYTDRTWGHASTYDLTLDSSLMPLDTLVDIIITYLHARLGNLQSSTK
ncbi:MAG: cytidylate kinase-like family protein [Bacteroidales bacterium]|nr:cytidylate kinase-like family protein [Bacteroidales bacterium]